MQLINQTMIYYLINHQTNIIYHIINQSWYLRMSVIHLVYKCEVGQSGTKDCENAVPDI